MIEKFNFHTHTQFCDAKNTAEEMVLSAIEKGISYLGFSGHSETPFDPDYCMNKESEKEYRTEIKRLKEKYKGKIEIFCGIEQDFHSEPLNYDYDFVIGSVHYVEKDGKLYSADRSRENFISDIAESFGGDYYEYAERYFKLIQNVLEKTKGNFIGHFDLVTKYNEGEVLFSESHPRYVNAYEEALEVLCKKDAVFEINTGVIPRGHKTTPYPSKKILKRIFELGGRITFSTDCHRKEAIDYGFLDAIELAKECGFKGMVLPVLNKDISI